MENYTRPCTRTILSLLWVVLMINMIYNDIFTIIVELDKWQRPEFPADAKTLMLVAVFLTNIPIMMIFLSRYLPRVANRRLNIGVAIFTVAYVWGGMSTYPHYIAVAIIETVLAAAIVVVAWRWKLNEA